MLREMEICWHVAIPKKRCDANGLVPQSFLLTCILKELMFTKCTEKHGYFLAITKLKSIGNGAVKEQTQDILFPVSFYCRTFLPINGEIMLGVVHIVYRLGVFLRCGPMKHIYLSLQKMPNFHYVQSGTQGSFLSDDLSRIQNDVVVRFVVFAVRWRLNNSDEFTILASIEGDCLGPVSLPGRDELDL